MTDKNEFIRYLEIALDMLDRAEGTTLYDINKKIMGWTDKEYSQMLESLAIFLVQIRHDVNND
jgi:hypothetical protein